MKAVDFEYSVGLEFETLLSWTIFWFVQFLGYR